MQESNEIGISNDPAEPLKNRLNAILNLVEEAERPLNEIVSELAPHWTHHSKDAPHQLRATLPELSKWELYGYTQREPARVHAAALLRNGWTVESRGLDSPVSDPWHREDSADRHVTKNLREVAQAALAETSDAVQHRAPELTAALRSIANPDTFEQEEGGSRRIYTTIHEMPEEANGGKPWQLDTQDYGQFKTWKEEAEDAVDAASNGLEGHVARSAQRFSDKNGYGWDADTSDAVHALQGKGHHQLREAIEHGGIVQRIWTNHGIDHQPAVVAEFENVRDVVVFTDEEMFRTQRPLPTAIREIDANGMIEPWNGWEGIDRIRFEYYRSGDTTIIPSPEGTLRATVQWMDADQTYHMRVRANEAYQETPGGLSYVPNQDVMPSDEWWPDSTHSIQGRGDMYGVPINDFVAQRIDERRQEQEINRTLSDIQTIAEKNYEVKERGQAIADVVSATLDRVTEPPAEYHDGNLKAGYATLAQIDRLHENRQNSPEPISDAGYEQFIYQSTDLVQEARSGRPGNQIQAMDDTLVDLTTFRHDLRHPITILEEMDKIAQATLRQIGQPSPVFQQNELLNRYQSLNVLANELRNETHIREARIFEAIGIAEMETGRQHPEIDLKYEMPSPYAEAVDAQQNDEITVYERRFAEENRYVTDSSGQVFDLEEIYSRPFDWNRYQQELDQYIRQTWGPVPGSPEREIFEGAVQKVKDVLHEASVKIFGPEENRQLSQDELDPGPSPAERQEILERESAFDRAVEQHHEQAIDLTEWRGTKATRQEIDAEMAERQELTRDDEKPKQATPGYYIGY